MQHPTTGHDNAKRPVTFREMRTQDIQERIRELAYLMWECAGRLRGLTMQYWLDAEKEVIGTVQAAKTRIAPKPEDAVTTGEKEMAQKAQKKTK